MARAQGYWDRALEYGPSSPLWPVITRYRAKAAALAAMGAGGAQVPSLKDIADRIQKRMGPVFGSPEYLADPVKLARATRRQRESAEAFAQMALDALAASPSHIGRVKEGG